MNQVFKVVRCLSTGVFKAVPEFAKSGKKSKSIAISASILSAGIAIASPAIADSAVGDPILSGQVTGQNSIAVGETNTIGNGVDGATSVNNVATGVDNSIAGVDSTAIGSNNSAQGYDNTAVGNSNNAKGQNHTTIGNSNTIDSAIGWNNEEYQTYGSTAVGSENYTSGSQASAFGSQNTVRGENSVAVGDNNYIADDYTPSYRNTAVGTSNRTNGNYNIVLGTDNRADTDSATVTGGYNYVDLMESGAYGQNNNVSVFGGGGENEAVAYSTFNDGIEPLLINDRLVQPTALASRSNIIVPFGGSYAYGNNNGVSSSQTHAVGNRNVVTSDFSGVLGSDNNISTTNNNDFEPPIFIEPLRMTALNEVGFNDSELGVVGENGNGSWVILDGEPTWIPSDNNEEWVNIGDGEWDGDAFIPNISYSSPYIRDSTGSFSVGNSTTIVGDNSHSVGNANTIKNQRSVAIGNSNVIEFYEPEQQNNSDFRPVNYSSAILGQANVVNAGGGHIVGTENSVQQQNSYIVGARNNTRDFSEEVSLVAFNETVHGTNILGSDNYSDSLQSSIVGDNNEVNSESMYSVVNGYQNFSNGASSSTIGTGNDISKDAGGAHGVANKVYGNSNIISALERYQSELMGEPSQPPIIDVDGDGVADYETPIEALQAMVTGGSYAFGNINALEGESVYAVGSQTTIAGDRSGSFGNNNTIGYSAETDESNWNSDAVVESEKYNDSFAFGNDNTINADQSFVLGNTSNVDRGAEGSLVLGSNALSVVAGGVAIGNGSVADRANSVSFGSIMDERQLVNVAAGTELTDAVNVGQLNESLRNVVTSVDAADSNILVENIDGAVTVGLNNDVAVNTVTTGVTSMTANGITAGSVVLSSETGLDNAGNRVTSVGDAIEESDAVNLKQLNASVRDTTGGKNITATRTDNGYAVALNDAVNLTSVTTGTTTVSTDGIQAGSVVLSSTTGLDNAGNRVTSVGDAIENTDAVNLKQLNDSLRDTTGDENITATQTETGYNVALNRNVDLDTVTTGVTSMTANGITAGSVVLSSETGLDNAGNRVTSVGDAIENTDAVNLKQLNDSLRDTTGDENITATQTETGYNVALNRNVDLDTVTTGVTSMSANGITAGSVVLSSETGLNNAGYRVSGVGDAINQDDAVNLKQLGESLRDTTGSKNITATRTDTGYQVFLNEDVDLASVTTGATTVNTNGITAGSVVLSSTTGLDNAGNRVTSVGDAIENTDAVNLKQLNDSLRDTTGDENITATQTETGYNVALNRNVDLDTVTTGATSMSTNGITTGDVILSSTSGLSNAGYRVTGVGDAINRDDAVNFGQFTDGLNGLTKTAVSGDENIISTKTDIGYDLALNKDITAETVTTGSTVISNNGLKSGDVTVTASGLDNAGNRVTSVGDATEQTDAVNLKQLNASLRDTTGDENITATQTETGYNVALNRNVDLDTVTTGVTSMSANGITAGSVVLSSETGLDNAGNRVTSVGDAIEESDAVNLGQVNRIDDRLTRENIVQNNNIANNMTNIRFNTEAINKGFSIGDGRTSTKYNLGDTVNITAGSNTVTTNSATGVEVALASDISVNTVSTGSTFMSNNGLTVGSVSVSSESGLNNAGYRVTGVGNAIDKTDAVNLGQFEEALGNLSVEGVVTNVSGDQNIVATTTGNNVSLALANDVNVNSVKAGNVSLSSTSGLNNAGFTVTGVGNAVNKSDAVNLGQLDAVDKRLTDENAAQNIIINSKADTTYVDAQNAAQNEVINTKLDIEVFEASQQAQNENLKIETDRLDAADKNLQTQVDNKVETTVFEADQARQDADLKQVSDDSQAADKDLQAQVNNKVETTVFEADQARQDALIDTKADKEFIQSTISTESARYDSMLNQSVADNSQRLAEMVDQQATIDLAQDARINDNSSRITDLGYKVAEMDDMFSSAIASTVAFASMPSALNPGETRISGGSGYYNGAGAIAVGLTGSNEDGAYNYKIGSSYTQKGGVVVGAGVSMRVW